MTRTRLPGAQTEQGRADIMACDARGDRDGRNYSAQPQRAWPTSRCWGLRRLVNSACARALADGIYSYRHVKAATEKQVCEALAVIDNAEATPVQGELALTQEHPLIRSGDDYAELFSRSAAHPTAHTTPNHATTTEFKA